MIAPMMVWGALLEAMRRVSRDMSELSDVARAKRRTGAPKPSTPARFSLYRDPKGRFELRYPTSWECLGADGVLVRSPKIGTFARVDVVPGAPIRWLDLEESVKKADGELTIEKHLKGPPKQVRGKLRMGGTRFAWNAYAYEAAADTVVLFTANVIDAGRSTRMERYEDKVLDAIRREFKAPSPPA